MDASLAVDWSGPIEDALSGVARFVPKFIVFVLILLVGWLLARLIRSGVDKVLERVGFDRAVERGGVGRALARTRYDASDLVAKLIYYAIILFALQLAFGIWGPNPVSELIEAIVAWLPRAVIAIVIVVVASAIAGAVKDLISGALGGLSYGRLLANLAAVFILGLGVIAALDQIGVATAVTGPVLIAVLATIAGILIVGVGGGLVRPMQQRWETWLSKAEAEVPEVAERLRSAAQERQQRTPAENFPNAGYVAEPPPYDGERLADAPTMIVPLARPPAGAPNPAESSQRLSDEQTSVIVPLEREPQSSAGPEFTSPFTSPFGTESRDAPTDPSGAPATGPSAAAVTDPVGTPVSEPPTEPGVSGSGVSEPPTEPGVSGSSAAEAGAGEPGAAEPADAPRPRRTAKKAAPKPPSPDPQDSA